MTLLHTEHLLVVALPQLHKSSPMINCSQEDMTSLGDPSITRRMRAAFLMTAACVHAQLECSGTKTEAESARSQTAHETLMQQRAGGDSRAAKDGILKSRRVVIDC